MSKYNLTDLLSEVKGGRIGTLNITAMDLERKMEELEGEGIKVSTFDGDNFGKTYIEYHVHPENKYDPDESFSIYDYKFGEDPTDIDNVDKEYPFSIGGMSAALNSAKALLGAGQASYSIDEGEAVDLAIEASQEKAGIEVDESFKSLAKKLDKQKGIDKDEAAKIAGSIAAKKAAGAGKGPTAKQKKRMKEASDTFNIDKVASPDAKAHDYGAEIKGISDEDDTEEAYAHQTVLPLEEIDPTLDPYEDRDEIIKQVMSLLIKEKGASREELKGFIEMHIEDILNAEDDDAIVDEFSQYLSVNESDKALQEHFKRFK